MKKMLLVLLFVILSQSVFSQSATIKNEQKNFTDTSSVIGVTLKSVFIGTEIKEFYDFCTLENKKLLPAKTILFIGGKSVCKNKDYYVVYYKTKKYYVEDQDIYVSQEDKIGIDNLKELSKDVFESKAKYYGELIYNRDLLLLKDFNTKSTKQGLIILEKDLRDESEYTDGTSLLINILNPSKKTIKYITFTIIGYNAVDDKVGNPITKKCIGPIAQDESGSYDFEYLWFTDIVETCKITNIKIQYMDNTYKTITNPKSIEIPNSLKYLLEE